MTDTGYKCAGKPLRVSDIVAERHMDASGGQVNFDLTYWKIIQHDGAFWRCGCDCKNNTEIKLDADLDIHFSPAGVIDLQDSNLQPIVSTSKSNDQGKKFWLLVKLTIAALIFYIVLRSLSLIVAADITAVICGFLAIITLKLHGGIHNEGT